MTNQKILDRTIGITIIEVIVTIGIFVVLLSSSVVGLYIYTVKVTPDLYAKSQIGIQYRITFEEFNRWISQSIQVEPSYGVYSIINNDLILKIPAIDGSNQIIANSYDRVIFQGAKEIISPAAGSSRTATNRRLIDNPITVTLSFYRSDGQGVSDFSQAERIGIQLWKQQVINGQTKTFAESRDFSLRNH